MSDEMSRMKRKRAANLTCEDRISPDGHSGEKWNEELHRCFVEAIYDAGVSQSSPSVILENMSNRPASLTSERVKSHLQKYRKNKQKSKEDFLQDYDSFMRKALTVGGAGGGASHAIVPPAAMIEMMGGGKPSGGDKAAFLSYSVMTEGEVKNNSGKTISSIGIAKESQDYLKNFAGTHVPFPQLTEEEKRSPLGISMVYVMGLFSSLSQHMMLERRKRFKPKNISEDEIPSVSQNTSAAGAATASSSSSIHYIKSNSTSATNSNANAFPTNKTHGTVPAHLFAQQAPHQHQHQQQQQDTNGQAHVPWANSALKQVHLVQQQLHQDGGTARAAALAIATNGLGPPAPAAADLTGPRGFFHPIVSKSELADSKSVDVPMGSTNWNTATMLQPPGVAVYEQTAAQQLQAHAGRNHGRGQPPHQGAPNGGSGPYAQV